MKTEAERFMSWAERPNKAIKHDICINDITDLYTAETGNELPSNLVELDNHPSRMHPWRIHYASRLYEFSDSSQIQVSYKEAGETISRHFMNLEEQGE